MVTEIYISYIQPLCPVSDVCCVLKDKQVAFMGGKAGSPYWGTNRLPLLGDKQVALIGGQTGCPYWGTNRLLLLGDKQDALIGGQTGCPYRGTIRLPLLRDKQVALIGGQTGCPYWGTDHLYCQQLVLSTTSYTCIPGSGCIERTHLVYRVSRA